MTGVTCEYFQLINNHLRAVYIPHVAQAQHVNYLQNFLDTTRCTRFFVNVDVSCTVMVAVSFNVILWPRITEKQVQLSKSLLILVDGSLKSTALNNN